MIGLGSDKKMMKRTPKTSSNELLRSKKGWGGEGGMAVSSRSFDLLNSMIYDLKISVDRPK